MLGLGKILKSVAVRTSAAPSTASTIPRALGAPKPAPAAAPSDFPEGAPCEERTAERFVPLRTATALTTTAGKRLTARIINVSRTGVAVEAELSTVDPLEVNMVGTRAVTPGRSIALGMVFLFKKPLDAKICNPDIVL